MRNPKRATSGAFEQEPEMVPLVEETATIEKRQVSAGKVVIRTVVETEDRLLRETLAGERVDVERVPIDRVVDVAPVVRTEGDVTIIPIVEERLVIERQLVLVEELRLHRHATTEAMEVPITLRRQRAVVERVDDAGSPVTEAQGWPHDGKRAGVLSRPISPKLT